MRWKGGRQTRRRERDGARTNARQAERRTEHRARAQSEWERAETGPHAVGLAAAAGEKRAGIMRAANICAVLRLSGTRT
jgi:hypothetical protein